MILFENEYKSGAEFSEDRTHRYRLWRIWDESRALVMFIGLNPSKAAEESTDPTIRAVIDFANDWGYGGFYMMNLYSVVSSDPTVLTTCDDPLRDNDQHLAEVSKLCADVVFAWGSFTEAHKRKDVMFKLFPDAYCIDKNHKGFPVHPLWARVWSKKKYPSPTKFF